MARVGQTIVNVPDATIIELYVDDEPLFVPTARTPEYLRVLDMRNGILTRELVWATPSGKHARVRSTRLVSFEHRHVVAMSYEVTMDRPAPVIIRSRVLNRANAGRKVPSDGAVNDPRIARRLGRRILEPRMVEQDGSVGARLPDGRERDDARVGRRPRARRAEPSRRLAARRPRRVGVRPGRRRRARRPVRLFKYAAYQTSRSVDAEPSSSSGAGAPSTASSAPGSSARGGSAEQSRSLLGPADVTLEDTVRHPVRMQQAVRWNLFHLAQATWRAEGAGIPAKGLTGDAYDGHYFWDTETWVLPFLAYTQPRIARNLLRFRHSMLDKARHRARQLDLRGALFPWRTIGGDEASAYHLAGTAQFHLNADIAYAIRRYVDVRGDTDFLIETGAEILVETARMWMDLGFFGDDGCFHIHGVTGPDEYTAMVDDNAYTNLMARLNLRYAAAVATAPRRAARGFAGLVAELALDPSEPDEWDRAADQMYVPHDRPAAGSPPRTPRSSPTSAGT